ncbi:MAG: CHASE2 domain-containing protein [Spirochaetia bacterium]|jgi:adenylate cyclase|nr:CHASE2 domain-containing protein [Spirochaetia bacterium]
MKKIILDKWKLFIIPAVVSAFFALLLLLPVYRVAEKRVYDVLLNIKPSIEERQEILLLNIDDLAIAQVGVWPWSRDIVADGLILMKEFDTSYVVFDIEYVDRSPQGIDSRYLEEIIPDLFTSQFSGLRNNIVDLFSAIAGGLIPLSDAEDYVNDLAGLTDSLKTQLLDAVNHIARDNDIYLGKTARLFDTAFFTVNMLPDDIQLINVSEELTEYVKSNISVKVSGFDPEKNTLFEKARSLQPAILPIISKGKGAGFPNVIVDDDGVRRRIDIFKEYEGELYPQLVTAPLLDYLGNPEVSVSGTRLTFSGVKYPDGSAGDITIPLTEEGEMLIHWPKKLFAESFRQLSFNNLVVHDKLLDNILMNLEIMDRAGYLAFYEGDTPLLDIYRYSAGIKDDILEELRSPDEMEEYRSVRKMFFEGLGELLNGNAEKAILARIDEIIAHPDFDTEKKEEYLAIRGEVESVFSAVDGDYKDLMKIRGILEKELAGSFAIMGYTGISTTDIGVNPFEKNYMNVGTHAAVANTILSGDFITELPVAISGIIASVLAFIVTFITRKTDPKKVVLIGLVFIFIVILAGAGVFISLKIYLPILTPLLVIFFTFLSISILKFIKSESEKSFLRNAFSRYLSADVISQLILDPDKLNLGGEKKNLTAVFTDVRGFSTISEKLDPQDLVKLLNYYLSAMSDIILENKGTIDKYEGDAIISFFGAPIDLVDHPYKACMSAVRMKREEKELNERFLRDSLSPAPLLTRVGVNTGEMVVGNMGTPRKMDYTIMGNSVNLAARLEGVNKQYGTWLLTSEATADQAGDAFLFRKLDRVRVVGINTPVRLFEIVEEKSAAESKVTEGIEMFHNALEVFEDKEWEKAEKLFSEILKVLPEDGPATTFIDRCQKYIKTPPVANWDGVFNLGVK